MTEAFPGEPSVLVVGGPLDSHEVKLSQGSTIMIGSGRLAHLRLDHPEIEMAHVKVTWDDAGISMIDNGSRKGTWVNGEPVETTGLIDGDVIEFVAPNAKVTPPPPKIRLKIPKGSVPEPPPLPPPPPEALAAKPSAGGGLGAAADLLQKARAKAQGRTKRARRGGFRLPDLRLAGLGAGALALLLVLGWAVMRFFFTAPTIVAVQPARTEPGRTITILGRRLSSDPAKNTVWFGAQSLPADSVGDGSVLVKVPPLPGGTVAVSVETSAGRSKAVDLLVLTPLKAAALDPPGALPGDEVVLNGQGFGDGVAVSVGGQPATVTDADGGSVRFTMPQLAAAVGSAHPVVATIAGRSTAPLPLYLGRVPLVTSFTPPRAAAGEIVRLRGIGFSADPDANVVTFDGVPALVLAASASELAVVAPMPVPVQAETLARLVVQAGGRTSGDGLSFPLLRLVEGAWVPHFLATPAALGARGLANVGTEVAPALLLAFKDESRSVGQRALQLTAQLNAAVDRARVGQKVAFEVREQPAIGVALVGAPDLLVRATPQDAAAYAAVPGLPARSEPPAPIALARQWAAILNDYLTLGTSGAEPTASATVSPVAGAAFRQLRAALPWQYGSGVPSARVAAVPAELRRRLREAALQIP